MYKPNNPQYIFFASPLSTSPSLHAASPPPVITGDQEVMEGGNFELVCTSFDTTKTISWSLLDSNLDLESDSSVSITGGTGQSTLTVTSARRAHAGTYQCSVGSTSSQFTVTVSPTPCE